MIRLKKIHVVVLLMSASLQLSAQEVPFSSSSRATNKIPDEFIKLTIMGNESPELIRDSYAITAFYSLVKTNESEADMSPVTLADLIGIDTQTVAVLGEIANTAALDEDRQQRTNKVLLCDSADFKANLEEKRDAAALLDAMDYLDSEGAQAVEDYFAREVTRLLGSATYDYLISWIRSNIKSGMKEVRIDHLKRDIALGRDPFSRIVKFCN